jgi:hypothetical protein
VRRESACRRWRPLLGACGCRREETAEKIADALGVLVEEIQWPMGYGERLPGGVLRVDGQVNDIPRVTLEGSVQMGGS